MVHTHRSTPKSVIAMDVTALRNTLNVPANKCDELSTSPRIGYKLEMPSRSSANSASNKWYYNNMVDNNRQEFNNLHFC